MTRKSIFDSSCARMIFEFSIMFVIRSSLWFKGVNKPLYSGIFKFTTISVKKLFKVSATFPYLDITIF